MKNLYFYDLEVKNIFCLYKSAYIANEGAKRNLL